MGLGVIYFDVIIEKMFFDSVDLEGNIFGNVFEW